MTTSTPGAPIRYRHTQTGVVVLAVFAAAAAVEAAALALWWVSGAGAAEGAVVAVALLLALVLAALAFSSLTVTVTPHHIELMFGVGPVRRRIPLREVTGARPVRNQWWWGWGIRWTPHGWLWNISGLDAVEISYRNGRRFRIGTDQPRELADAINAAIGRAP